MPNHLYCSPDPLTGSDPISGLCGKSCRRPPLFTWDDIEHGSSFELPAGLCRKCFRNLPAMAKDSKVYIYGFAEEK